MTVLGTLVICPLRRRDSKDDDDANQMILRGNGSNLELINSADFSLIDKLEVFRETGSTIHGIESFSDTQDAISAIVFGEKNMTVCTICLNKSKLSRNSKIITMNDWILAAKCLQGRDPDDGKIWGTSPCYSGKEITFAVLTSRNSVYLYRYSFREETLSAALCVKSQNHSIMLSGLLLGKVWTELASIVGTMFGDILLTRCHSKNAQLIKLTRRHEGMIFAMAYSARRKLLYSISDDRRLIVWHFDIDQAENVQYLTESFGHSARPWCLYLLEDGTRLVTGGADSAVCFWEYNSQSAPKISLIKRVILDHGTIRSLNFDESTNYLFIGTENGSLCRLSTPNLNWRHSVTFETLCSLSDEKICSFVSMDNKDIFACTQSGKLLHSVERDKFCLLIDQNLRPDTLVLNKEWKIVIICSKRSAYILNIDEPKTVIRRELDENCEVLALNLIKNAHNRLLISFANDVLALYEVKKSDLDINLIKKFNFKYLTGNRLPNCSIIWNGFLIFGDRHGSIWLFSVAGENAGIICFAARAHGKQGVTDIFALNSNSSQLVSIGRDGKMCTWSLNENIQQEKELNRLSVENIGDRSDTMEWPAKFVIDSSLIAGFRGPNFTLFDRDTNHYLCSINCGGGHRFWSVEIPFYTEQRSEKVLKNSENDRNKSAKTDRENFDSNAISMKKFSCDGRGEKSAAKSVTFRFIKNGVLTEARAFLWSLANIRPHLHTSQINAIVKVNIGCSNLPGILTAGVDTRIVFTDISNENEPNVLNRYNDHLSSVHCLTIYCCNNIIHNNNNNYKNVLVASGGGRGEIRLWAISGQQFNRLTPIDALKHNKDARVLSVKFISVHQSLFLIAAISDGSVNSYKIDRTSKAFEKSVYRFLPANESWSMGCVSKIAVKDCNSETYNCKSLIIAVDTKGYLYRWDFDITTTSEKCIKAQSQIEVEKCGLSALDLTDISGSSVAFVGSESGTLTVLPIDEIANRQHSLAVPKSRNNDRFPLKTVHSSTITAIRAFSSNESGQAFAMSLSLDRRLTLSQVNISKEMANFSINVLKSIILAVFDPSDFVLLNGNNFDFKKIGSIRVAAVGSGLQIVHL